MVRRRVVLGLAAAVLVVGAALPTTAHAGSVILTGGGGWALVVNLPGYPCPGGCSFNASGEFGGTIEAVDEGTIPTPTPKVLYTATWPGGVSNFLGDLSLGTVGYSESCATEPFISPLSGAATGTFTISGGRLQPPSPGGSTVAQLTGSFSMGRSADALMLLTMYPVTLEDGSGVALASATAVGRGVGVFTVPVETLAQYEANPLPPNCANFQAVSVPVAGTYVQPG